MKSTQYIHDNWGVDVPQHVTRLSGLDKFLDNSHLVPRRALLEHSLLVGIYAKGVLAYNRNSSEQRKLLDKSRNQH